MRKWKEHKLGEFASIQTGPFGSQLHSSDYVSTGIPSIMPTNIGPRLNVVTDNIAYVSTTDIERLKKYVVQEGDIVYSRRGNVEKCAFITEKQNGWLCGTGCLRIRFLSAEVVPRFGAYYLSSPEVKSWVLNSSVGSTMPNLNSSILRDLPLLLPERPEQQAITEVLSSLDEKIELLHSQNETLEGLAETLFRQWFIEEAEPTWRRKSLAEIADYLNGLALQNYRSTRDDSLPVIKIRELNQGITERTERCSRAIPEQYIIHDGDILFSWSGSLEIVIWHDGEGALNQHLFKVTSKRYPKWFYYLATKHHLKNFRAIAESKSTTMGHIQRHHLSDAQISIPNDESFREFDEMLSGLIEKLIKNNAQIKTLTNQRDSLLPKLMSRKVRVEM